jgi:hypothetical protein
MPRIAAHQSETIERSHDLVRTLTVSQVDGASAFFITDARIPGMTPLLQGPSAAGARPVSIPKNMSVRIENLGDYPIDYTIT